MLRLEQPISPAFRTFRNKDHAKTFADWMGDLSYTVVYVHGGDFEGDPTIVVSQNNENGVIQIARVFDIGGKSHISIDLRAIDE